MLCKDCVYYWADTEEYIGEDGQTHLREVGRPHCQYNYNDHDAPCEHEEYDEPEEYHDEREAYDDD